MEQSWEGEPRLRYVFTFQENKSTMQECFTVERGHTYFRGVCMCVCTPVSFPPPFSLFFKCLEVLL